MAKDKAPVALAGQVVCNVTTEAGPIKKGDLLVTSSTPGHAMRIDPKKAEPGTVLGVALQSFSGEEKKTGQIIIFVGR